jgi:hypothetical protein
MISTTKISNNAAGESKIYERTAHADASDNEWLYITLKEDHTYSDRTGRKRNHALVENNIVCIFVNCENKDDLLDEFKPNWVDGKVSFYIQVSVVSSYQLQKTDTVIRIRRHFIFQRIPAVLELDLSDGVIPVDEEKLKQMIDLGIDETKAREFLFITIDDLDEAIEMYYDSLNDSFDTGIPGVSSPSYDSDSPPWGGSDSPSPDRSSGPTARFVASDDEITMVQSIVSTASISKIKQVLSDTAGNVALTVQLLLEQEDGSLTVVPVINSFNAFLESSDSDDSVDIEILTERIAKLVVDADAERLNIPSKEYLYITAGTDPHKLISVVYKVPRYSLYPRVLLTYESSSIIRFHVKDVKLRQDDVLLKGSESIHHRPIVFKLNGKIYIHRGCFERIEYNHSYIDAINMNANGVFLKKENNNSDQKRRLIEAHHRAREAFEKIGDYGGGEFKNNFDQEGPDHKLEEAALSDDPIENHQHILNLKFKDIADRVQLAKSRNVPKMYIRNFIKLSMKYIQIQLDMSHALLKKTKSPATLLRASSMDTQQEPVPVLLRNRSSGSYVLNQLKKQRRTLQKIIRLDPTKERLDKLKRIEIEIKKLS